ncbi:MAG: N-acetylglucosamine-6-phosphate deacetylase [Streptosporangiaceae bacterium]
MLIAAGRILTAADAGGPGDLRPGYLAIADGVITAVGQGPPPARPDVDLAAGVLLPGFVDLQVNGSFGVDLGTADGAGVEVVSTRLPQTGVTSYLPTIITGPLDELTAALARWRRYGAGPAGGGARVLGVHLEGPFIAERWRGAHNPRWITSPDPAPVDRLIAAGAGVLRVITLAPELAGALAAIDRFRDAGVVVSVGHSDATARQVAAAADRGATMVTHLFNAQRPMHHREPGVAGQALADPRLAAGLIADLHHVSGQVAAIAFAAAPGRIFLVTDAAACAGMPSGRYLLGGEPIYLPADRGAPPVRADGTLAGSALRLDRAVANLVGAGIGLREAVAAATAIPADLIGRPDLGRITPGAAADLTWLTKDLRAAATWVGGRLVFGRPPR